MTVSDTPEPRAPRWPHLAALGLVLLAAAAFRLAWLDRPFLADSEGTNAYYGVLARNYLEVPWSYTLGMPVLSVGRVPGAEEVFYYTHPPMVPLSIVPAYALWGVGEWQTRLSTALFTLACVAAVYLLLAWQGRRRAGLLAAAVFASLPMVLYYGGMPEVVGMQLMLFSLLTMAAYLRLHAHPTAGNFGLVLAALAAAALADWPAFFLVPVLTIHWLWTRPRQWGWLVALGAASSVLFLAVYAYSTLATGAPPGWIISKVSGRSGVNAPFTAGEWLATAWRFNLDRHTLPVLLLATGWIVARVVRPRAAGPGDLMCALVLAWGVLHVLVGREGVYIHDWWWTPLTPGLALATGLVLDRAIAGLTPGLGRWAPAGAAAMVVAFAAWTHVTTWREFAEASNRPSAGIFTVGLGQAIQTAAPSGDGVVALAWSSGMPQIWFYGNRPVKLDVWTPEDLADRRDDGLLDLPLRFQQPAPARPVGVVLVNGFGADAEDLAAHLRAYYPQRPVPAPWTDSYQVFDLTRPLERTAEPRGGGPRHER